jgi:peptide chain release factor 1
MLLVIGNLVSMQEPRKPIFSVTAADCEWSYTRGTGKGGQKKNKTNSAVHCMHRPSGAHGYSEASRSQAENRRDAFVKMAESKQFREWNRLELMRRLGMIDAIDRQIEYELTHNIKLEIKIDGRWTEVKESMLVDDPDDFRWESGLLPQIK